MLRSGELRLVYFLNNELRATWYSKLLKYQGFAEPIEQYKIKHYNLQRGDITQVFHAKHHLVGTEVAIKVIDKDTDGDSDLAHLQNLRVEASTLYRCRHPNIVRCIEFHEADDMMFMVTDFCTGGDLQTYMNKHELEVLSEDRLHAIAVKIGGALSYLHDKGVVHRDIKQDNILLKDTSDDSEPILCDFGFA